LANSDPPIDPAGGVAPLFLRDPQRRIDESAVSADVANRGKAGQQRGSSIASTEQRLLSTRPLQRSQHRTGNVTDQMTVAIDESGKHSVSGKIDHSGANGELGRRRKHRLDALVPHVPDVKRFVGVWLGILDHDAVCLRLTAAVRVTSGQNRRDHPIGEAVRIELDVDIAVGRFDSRELGVAGESGRHLLGDVLRALADDLLGPSLQFFFRQPLKLAVGLGRDLFVGQLIGNGRRRAPCARERDWTHSETSPTEAELLEYVIDPFHSTVLLTLQHRNHLVHALKGSIELQDRSRHRSTAAN
jgi:hypothetical protein